MEIAAIALDAADFSGSVPANADGSCILAALRGSQKVVASAPARQALKMSRRVMAPPGGSRESGQLLKPTELQPQRGKRPTVYRAFTEETDGALRSAIAGVHNAHDERELRTSVNLGLLSILHALLALDERLWRLENELCRMQIP